MIPLATTTVTVKRAQNAAGGSVDAIAASYGFETDTVVTVARGLRAHIGSPGGSDRGTGGIQETMNFHATTDPFDIQPFDQVVDERTGQVYTAQTCAVRTDIGFMAHSQVELVRIRGQA